MSRRKSRESRVNSWEPRVTEYERGLSVDMTLTTLICLLLLLVVAVLA